MSIFTSRTSGYKAGVVLLFVASVVFFVGFVTPFWLFASGSSGSFSGYGLWMGCASVRSFGYSSTECATYTWRYLADWLHAVRALECLCFIGLFAACVYAIVTNCCRCVSTSNLTRVLEALSALSGVLGFIGCMVYVGKQPVQNKKYLHFSFYLCTIGSVLCVVAAIIILICNKPLPDNARRGNVVTMDTIPPAPGQVFTSPQSYSAQVPAQPYGNPQLYSD